MENFTPITQIKAITMDYEEYLKLEDWANKYVKTITDIINAKSLDVLKLEYIEILDKINKSLL